MYLTATNLASYLIGRGLIDANSVVDGDFVIIEAGRRNRNFKVLRGKLPGLFVKQISNTASWEPIITLQREAALYAAVSTRPHCSHLANLMQDFIDYNPANCSLIIGLVPNGESLLEYHYQLGTYPEEAGEIVGRNLATYHFLPREVLTELSSACAFPWQIPWILTLDPVSFFPLSQFPGSGSMLIAALQQLPALLQCLLALRYEWRYEALIHGDMKWDNLVIGEGVKREPDLRIIDWELVDIGDAAWDVGSVFASYLVDWLLALHAPAQRVPLDFGVEARNRLVQMQPALRKFWTAYTSMRGFGAAAARQYLEKCVRFAAARLVLAVFEFLYGSPQMTAAMLSMLQASQNILLNPTRAASELLGL
jgi:hypothetical protein